MRRSAALKILTVATLLGAAGAGIATAAAPLTGLNFGVLAQTLAVVGLHALAGVALSTAIDRGRMPPLMYVGLIIGLVAAGAWLAVVWRTAPPVAAGADLVRLAAAIASGWMAVLAVIGVSLMLPANRRAARLTQAACVVLCVTVFLVWPLFLWQLDFDPRDSEVTGRVLAAVSMLAIAMLGTGLFLAHVHTLRPEQPEQPEQPERAGASGGGARRVTVVCPRCGEEQAIGLGGAACRGCSLQITVQVP